MTLRVLNRDLRRYNPNNCLLPGSTPPKNPTGGTRKYNPNNCSRIVLTRIARIFFIFLVDTSYNMGYCGVILVNRSETMKTVTKKELFQWQAPSFNFDLNADQLLSKALKIGFVTKVSDDKYLVNEGYGS